MIFVNVFAGKGGRAQWGYFVFSRCSVKYTMLKI